MPDLRGLFLRGVGGNAAMLGSVQEDAGRNITGTFSSEAQFLGALNSIEATSGCFSLYGLDDVGSHIRSGGDRGTQRMTMDASRVWGATHTTDAATGEFRPVNRAVRYLIRAQP